MLDSFLFMCVGDLSHTFIFFFFNDTATTEIYTLSLHDALPISLACFPTQIAGRNRMWRKMIIDDIKTDPDWKNGERSEEHTSELQSRLHLVCRLLLEKKKTTTTRNTHQRHPRSMK